MPAGNNTSATTREATSENDSGSPTEAIIRRAWGCSLMKINGRNTTTVVRVARVTGNATSDEVLLEAGVTRARALATVLPDDALNVFITLTARNLNPDLRIIARAEDPASDAKMIQAGADKVVLPSALSGERAAQMILRPAMVDFFADQDLSGLEHELRGLGLQIEQFEVDGKSSLIGRSVGALESSGDGGFLVIAIRRAGGQLIRNPEKHFTFAEEDSVLFMGHAEDIPHLREAFALANIRPAVLSAVVYRGAKRHG